MFSFIRTQIDQLVSFLRPLRLNERTDSGETLLSGPPKRSYCSRSITLHQDIKTPCTRDAPRSSVREKRLSARTANATTGRERAVSFDSKVVKNLLDDDDDQMADPMSISSSDDEGLDCWFSPVEPQQQKDPLPVSSER